MSQELLVASMARQWAARLLPAEPWAAGAAEHVALHAYAGGGSVSEACREVRRFAASWARHPSHPSHPSQPPARRLDAVTVGAR